MRVALVTGLLLAAAACGVDALRPVNGDLRVTPSQVDFGRVVRGQSTERTLELENTSRGDLEVALAVTGSGFELLDAPTRLIPGSTEVRIRFRPGDEGAFDGACTVRVPGFEPVIVPLSGEGAPIPDCVATAACQVSAWSATEGRCVESQAPDGTGCEAACLTGATCSAGRCVGAPLDCDDANACTVDSCDPSSGCTHVESVTCPGAGPCQVGVCDPDAGCGLAPAVDGTPCGMRRDCNAADVCISGECVLRDPPDNFVCADESPCQGEGRCQGDLCVRPPATVLTPSWQRGDPPTDGGQGDLWTDLLLESDGGVTLSSYFVSQQVLNARSPSPVTLPQTARRCIHWRGMLVCADYPANVNAGVSAIDEATGNIVWTYGGIAADLPEYAGPTVQVFLARLMTISDQELVALFESRVLNPDGTDPRCRHFALVVLDAQGHAVTARRVENPIFEVCTHPHPYGAAVDASGNVYLAFTPSGQDNPATALEDTLLMSYSPVLQPRWVHPVAGLPGGELSVAGAWLFHERSASAFSTTTGAPGGGIAVPFGLGVATRDLLIAAPADQTVRLEAFDGMTLTTKWQRQTNGVPWFTGAPLALATFATPSGPRPVVLAFDSDGLTHAVSATDTETGAELFRCPMAVPETPGFVSPSAGGLAVASQALTKPSTLDPCLQCDPRFARSRMVFQWFDMPGLSPGVGRWPGLNGGVGHDHREDVVP